MTDRKLERRKARTRVQDCDRELRKLKNRTVTTGRARNVLMEEIPNRAQGLATAKSQIKGVQKGWSSYDVQVQHCP